jgi:hypothetical protein
MDAIQENNIGTVGPNDTSTNNAVPKLKLAFSIPETSKIIGVSDITIRRLLRRGKLRALNSLRHKIIPLGEIERFLRADLS